MTLGGLHESYLRYRSFRWAKVSVLLVVAAAVAYLVDSPEGGRRGDTVYGYAVGILCGLLMLWLTWFGARKRSYGSTGAPLRGWLSAHVYLGLSLPFLVPLHCAFRFGWNVHTLAYAILLLVVATGLVGVLVYGRVPGDMTANRSGITRDSLLEQLSGIDAECRQLVAELPDVFADAVRISIEETRVGGGILSQLRGRDRRCGTARAIGIVESNVSSAAPAQRTRVTGLLQALALKGATLERVRRDVRFQALLESWLLLHVPLAFASLAALAAHVFVVLYW